MCGDWGAGWRRGKRKLSKLSEELPDLSREKSMVHPRDRLYAVTCDLFLLLQSVEAVSGG